MNRIFILFLLLINICIAQEKEPMYYIDLTDINVIHKVEDELCTSETYIKVIYKGGKDSKTVFYTNSVSARFLGLLNILFEARNVKLDEHIAYIEMFRRVVDARDELVSTCCNCKHTSKAEDTIPHEDISYCKTNSVHFGEVKSGDGQAKADLKFNYKIRPHHTLSSEKLRDTISNTYLPIGTKVKLFAKEGFP
ncbi:hypothetical protein ACI76O_11935, partial [Capnocytophaga cynodegmi]